MYSISITSTLSFVRSQHQPKNYVVLVKHECSLWHHRLAYPLPKIFGCILFCLRFSTTSSLTICDCTCCLSAKMTEVSFYYFNASSTNSYSDVWAPYLSPIPLNNGYRFYDGTRRIFGTILCSDDER